LFDLKVFTQRSLEVDAERQISALALRYESWEGLKLSPLYSKTAEQRRWSHEPFELDAERAVFVE
jgi:hypothetical protein